jgi:hypothetical protein
MMVAVMIFFKVDIKINQVNMIFLLYITSQMYLIGYNFRTNKIIGKRY